MQRLLHRLEDHLLLQPEQRADAGGRGGAEMGDMVDLVLMQADRLHQVDLDLVARRQTADQVAPGPAEMLRYGQDGRDVVAGMGIVGGEEGVVHVELAHRRPIRPGRPFRRDDRVRLHAEDGGAGLALTRLVRMAERHHAGRDHGLAVDGGDVVVVVGLVEEDQ